MDKTSLLQEIGLLKAAHSIKKGFKSLDIADIYIFSQAYEIYQNFFYQNNVVADQGNGYGKVISLESFIDEFQNNPNLYSDLVNALKKEANTTEEPEQEVNSVPSTLEAMVAAYNENELAKADLENEKPDTISAAIKRALKTQAILRKAEIRKKNLKEPDEDKFFSKYVDTKDNDRQKTEYEIRQAVKILVSREKFSDVSDKSGLIEELVIQVESGTTKLDNYKELDAVAEALAIDYGHKSVFNEVVELTKEQAILEETDAEPEEIEAVNLKIRKLNIDQDHYKRLQGDLEKLDYDRHVEEAVKLTSKIQDALQKAIPNPQIPFSQINILERQLQQFEKLVDQSKSDLVSRYTSGGAAEIAGTLSQTGGNISPTTIKLIGRGLDSEEKLNKFFDSKKDNPEFEKFRHLISTQFKKVYKSKLLGDIQKNKHFSKLPEILSPKTVIENYVHKKIGEHVGKTIVKYSSKAAAKKLGGYIVKHGVQEGAKKFASAVGQKLLVAAAKQAGVGAAKVAGMAAADGVIASAAVALGISTAGLSLIIGAVLIAAQIGWEVAKYGYKKLYEAIWNEEFDFKKALGRGAAIGAGLIALPAIVGGGFRGFAIATKAAAISAVGIIILSISTIAVFLTFTFLTAPLLSTFVQLDSVEKVKYDKLQDNTTSSSDCGWPIQGNYQVIEGPKAGTHELSQLQAIDIWGADIDGKPLLSATDGEVIFVGDFRNYGNTIKIKTTNSAGTFVVAYGHVSDTGHVTVGQKVKKGDKIGLVNSSAQFKDPHIHMEYLDLNDGNSFDYNNCPAGGIQITKKCKTFEECGSITTGGGITTM